MATHGDGVAIDRAPLECLVKVADRTAWLADGERGEPGAQEVAVEVVDVGGSDLVMSSLISFGAMFVVIAER
jgi:hypothetical protein